MREILTPISGKYMQIIEPLEIEVKFYIAALKPVRDRILATGGVSTGRIFENNIRFEDINQSLIKKKFLLRLRKDRSAKLTFKSTPPAADNQFKIRRELEVEVSDFSTMYQILELLGFHKEQTYEKWRESFVINGTHLCIDEMPYGNFLEIEGEKENIRALAHQLGLHWEKRILPSYLKIFSMIKEKQNLSFSDLTFDNFKHVTVDLTEYLPLIEVGES